MTLLIVPSLPAASMPWSTTRTERRASAQNRSCELGESLELGGQRRFGRRLVPAEGRARVAVSQANADAGTDAQDVAEVGRFPRSLASMRSVRRMRRTAAHRPIRSRYQTASRAPLDPTLPSPGQPGPWRRRHRRRRHRGRPGHGLPRRLADRHPPVGHRRWVDHRQHRPPVPVRSVPVHPARPRVLDAGRVCAPHPILAGNHSPSATG